MHFVAGRAHVRLSLIGAVYSTGDENSASLTKGLIGLGLFQSAALGLKWGLPGHWSVHPPYRFESHQHFDAHAVGLSGHWKYEPAPAGEISA